MRPLVLDTARLRLRPLRVSDAAAVHEMSTRKGVAVPAGYMTPKDFAASRARVARNAAQWRKKNPPRLDFAVLRREDGAFLGLINLNWLHPGVGSLGYGFHPKFWGRGYASEAARRVVDLAFDELGAHRVQATCWVKNPASAAVLKKAGLKKEGTLKGFLKRGTVVRDEFIFGLARADR